MSRRSLRLDDGLLDHSLPHTSASFSVGGTAWRSSRLLKCNRSQQFSVSCSDSLLLTAAQKSNGLCSDASDASLLSSLVDDSSIQENTLVDSFWGLDHDMDPKESTIIGEQTTVLADRTLIGSDDCSPKQPVQTVSRFYCQDFEPNPDRKDSTYCPSSSSSCMMVPGLLEPKDSETSIYCRERKRRPRTARSRRCGVMNLKEASINQRERRPNGALCDDCKEKQCTETSLSSPSWFSVASCLLTLMWSTAAFTASCLCQLTLSAASQLWPLIKKTCSACWRAGCFAGKTAVDVYRWASRRKHHLTSSLQACFPMRTLLVLPLLLLLFSLCWFSPATLHCLLPAIHLTEWSTTVSGSIYDVICSQSQSTEGALEEKRGAQPHEKLLCWRPPLEEVAEDESARLIRLEQSVTALWEQVEAGGRWAEQRHREVLQLYAELRQEKQQPDGDGVWLTSLMEQQLEHFRTQLDKERQQEKQTQQQHQMSRVDELELQLQTLAAQTEELQQKQGAVTSSLTSLPADVRGGVEHQSHDTLLAEVARLEAILEDIRQEVASLSACHDSCKRLDNIQEGISDQVSSQVRHEVRTQVYGNQMVRGGTSTETAPPESLLQWLSQHYVSGTEMQAELSSLELRILQNISQQLEQYRGEDAAGDSTGIVITQKDVHMIVEDALRRFSQDKTSMADYALESGGGSILSTRCSETYKTKTALLSLFGFPLWYFSQSPRAVIQPDVHLGNCWAFKGSKGFLVIRLSMQIFPTAFSLEHIPKVLSPSRMLHSAPREFSVYGLDDESQERGELLGSFTYDQDGEALQTFAITEDCNWPFQIIEVQVLSNWGHPDYTCMYRFRVHGTPAAT